MIIETGIANSFKRIELREYLYLETIHIGEDCFPDVTCFEVSKCPRLTSIMIERNAFKAEETSSGLIAIRENQSLQTFVAKSDAFHRYSTVIFKGIIPKKYFKDLLLLQSINLLENVFQGSSKTDCSLILCGM